MLVVLSLFLVQPLGYMMPRKDLDRFFAQRT